jgi:hypothetical protein
VFLGRCDEQLAGVFGVADRRRSPGSATPSRSARGRLGHPGPQVPAGTAVARHAPTAAAPRRRPSIRGQQGLVAPVRQPRPAAREDHFGCAAPPPGGRSPGKPSARPPPAWRDQPVGAGPSAGHGCDVRAMGGSLLGRGRTRGGWADVPHMVRTTPWRSAYGLRWLASAGASPLSSPSATSPRPSWPARGNDPVRF